MKWIWAYVILVFVVAIGVMVTVKTQPCMRMELTDHAEQQLQSGELIHYCTVKVDADDIDSAACRRYASDYYHRIIPDSVNKQIPVQVRFFFYRQSELQDLDAMDIQSIAHNDSAAILRARKLGYDAEGFAAVRFSDVYRIFGRDTLYGVHGKVIIPRYGLQIASFFPKPSSTQQ